MSETANLLSPAPRRRPSPAHAPGGHPAAQAAPDDQGSLSPEDARKLRSEAKNLRDRLKTAEEDLKTTGRRTQERQKLERDKNARRSREGPARVEAT